MSNIERNHGGVDPAMESPNAVTNGAKALLRVAGGLETWRLHKYVVVKKPPFECEAICRLTTQNRCLGVPLSVSGPESPPSSNKTSHRYGPPIWYPEETLTILRVPPIWRHPQA